MKPKIARLYDSHFSGQHCVHASDGAFGRAPRYVQWERVTVNSKGPFSSSVAWFTGSHFHDAEKVGASKYVAWMLEPIEYRPEHYSFVEEHTNYFDYIVTHDAIWGSKFKKNKDVRVAIAPFGGTRLHFSDWTPEHPKSVGDISMPYTDKESLSGHRFRKEVFNHLIDRPNVWTPKKHVPKSELVLPFMYTVAIEAVQWKNWFTEWLIDPILAGTVPIYWGAQNLEDYGFCMDGIIQIRSAWDHEATLDDVDEALSKATPVHYFNLQRTGVLQRNFIAALRYQMAEDYLCRTYPELFSEGRN